MGKYEGTWKTVNGEKFFVAVKDGFWWRKILLRDGKYSYTDKTLESSRVFKPLSTKSLEKQLTETIDSYVGQRGKQNEAIDRVCEQMNEVYSDDW